MTRFQRVEIDWLFIRAMCICLQIIMVSCCKFSIRCLTGRSIIVPHNGSSRHGIDWHDRDVKKLLILKND